MRFCAELVETSLAQTRTAGGQVIELIVEESCTATLSGGQTGTLGVYDYGTATIIGKDFVLHEGLSMNGDDLVGTGNLSGNWLDGTPFLTLVLHHNVGAHVYLVPEPGSLCLFALGGPALLRRRRS